MFYKNLKEHRPVSLHNLTSLQEQYVFLHQAVMEALTCGDTEIAPEDLRIAIDKLARTQKSSQRNGFAMEFKVLQVCFVLVEKGTGSIVFLSVLFYRVFFITAKYHQLW